MTDDPLILYGNKIPDQYSMVAGVEQSGLLFGEAQTWDCLRNWIVTTDGTGVVTVQLDYLADPGLAYLILGAHRHDTAGARFSGGSVQLQYWNGSAYANCLAATAITAATNEPSLHQLSAHTIVVASGYYSYRMTISGMLTNSDIALPELFLGDAMVMPSLSLGFDPLTEEWDGPKFQTESGRIYESAISRRYVSSPKWGPIIGSAKALEIDAFRENHIENRTPFWWFWSPLSYPTQGFMMRHNGKTVSMPINAAGYRSFSIDMVEAV